MENTTCQDVTNVFWSRFTEAPLVQGRTEKGTERFRYAQQAHTWNLADFICDRFPEMELIAITAHPGDHRAEPWLGQGDPALLVKPIDPEVLLKLIDVGVVSDCALTLNRPQP